jgi:ATP-dependent Clp protease adaptor protein ClpS
MTFFIDFKPLAAHDTHVDEGDGDGLALLDREPEQDAEKAKMPPLYAVFLLNDDYTPMEFVVAVLRQVFAKSDELSVAIMLKVHHEGRGICGAFTKDIALTKVEQVMALASRFEHPLQCVAEPIEQEP